jgi:hypothetical protein
LGNIYLQPIDWFRAGYRIVPLAVPQARQKEICSNT